MISGSTVHFGEERFVSSVHAAENSPRHLQVEKCYRPAGGHSGQVSPIEANTSRTSGTPSFEDRRGSGSCRAISKARSRACGSARSWIQPCSPHSRMAPALLDDRPDDKLFQYIVYPGGGATLPTGPLAGKALRNASVLGLRTTLNSETMGACACGSTADCADSARARIKGKTIKEIARDLKVSRNTVRKVLRSGETSFKYERQVQPRPKLGRWAVELDGLLVANAAKPAHEHLTLIRIFEELRGRGYRRLRCRAALRQAVEQGTQAIDRGGLCPAALRLAKPTCSTGATRWSC